MKTFQGNVTLLLALVFIFSQSFTSADLPVPVDQGPRWEKLGQRTVNRRLDRDEIVVTAREGAFTAIKFRVRNSGINMHRLVVHYRNGEKHEVALRNNIPAGGESRVIDLPGRKRIIKKVVFWYDTKGIINDKAVISLWGRH